MSVYFYNVSFLNGFFSMTHNSEIYAYLTDTQNTHFAHNEQNAIRIYKMRVWSQAVERAFDVLGVAVSHFGIDERGAAPPGLFPAFDLTPPPSAEQAFPSLSHVRDRLGEGCVILPKNWTVS